MLFQNDRRSYVSENLRRSIQAELRRNDLHQSRAGGIRTHDIRLLKHVLQLGSRSLSPNVSIAAEGEGVEPSRLVMQARPASNRVPSPFGLPFRYVFQWLDQESNLELLVRSER